MSTTIVSETAAGWKRWARGGVLVLLAGIAGYDVGIGARMLASAEPWRVLGDDTLWAGLGSLPETERFALEIAMRRIGAFSLLAGVMQGVLLVAGRWDRRAWSVLLVVQLLVGPVFFWVDQVGFAGTDYLDLKSAMGTAWVVALILHLASWRER